MANLDAVVATWFAALTEHFGSCDPPGSRTAPRIDTRTLEYRGIPGIIS